MATKNKKEEEKKVIDFDYINFLNNFNSQNISEYAERAYLDYSISVVKGRAIPSIEDGLKPVHRRLIYTMCRDGMLHNSIHRKSAKVVGAVLGSFHPHGDQSVYDALVRQTQEFNVRYPLIDGQGNFGSRDGDGAASMRYTEIKLDAITQLYLDEIKDNCVDFMPNYDGNELEPKLLPARIPFILLNGNPGIAVGMATEIPSHNLKEVVSATIAYLENKKITLPEILQHIKGPDFNTRAQIISSKEEIEKMYQEGRGSIRLRAKYVVENEGTKNWKLVFNEIPYGVSGQQIMNEIDAIFNPEDKSKKDKSKGKEGKKITLEQLRLKTLFSDSIDKYTNASDRNNPIRLVLEPKSHKQNPHELAQILLAFTSLEKNFSANFVCIGRDGRPLQKNLMEIIAEWTEFRLETIDRRTRYHLQKIAERLHILDGRKIVLNNLDLVINIIRKSDDPRKDLIEQLHLSEIQVQDVLELKLRQISNLEAQSIIKEYNELLKRQDELNKIIANEQNLKKQAIKELKLDMEKYGDERKTEINFAEKINLSLIQEKSAKVSEEKITLGVSKKGWVKVLKGEKEITDFSFKEGDSVDYHFYCKNTDTLAAFDSEGKVYNYALNEISKEGSPINTLFSMSGKFLIAFPIHKDFKYVLAHNKGYGFIITGENLMTKLKVGKVIFNIPEDATMLQPLYFKADLDKDNLFVSLISTENKVLNYKLSDISEIGKGKGVGLMGFNGEHTLKDFKLLVEKKVKLRIKNKQQNYGLLLEGEDFEKCMQNRSVSAKGKTLNIKDKLSEVTFDIIKEKV